MWVTLLGSFLVTLFPGCVLATKKCIQLFLQQFWHLLQFRKLGAESDLEDAPRGWVFASWSSQSAGTESCIPGGLSSRPSFLSVLEAGSWVPGKNPFPAPPWLPTSWVLSWLLLSQREKERKQAPTKPFLSGSESKWQWHEVAEHRTLLGGSLKGDWRLGLGKTDGRNTVFRDEKGMPHRRAASDIPPQRHWEHDATLQWEKWRMAMLLGPHSVCGSLLRLRTLCRELAV